MPSSNTENLNEDLNTNFPDPVDFINKSYKSFSLHDLQDALIAFSKSSAETKGKMDEIIPKNFAKFINCKEIMQKIKEDYTDRSLLSSDMDGNIALLIQKFDSLIIKHNIKLTDDTDQDTSRSSLLFVKELKEILRSNILNFDVFISILKYENESMKNYGIAENKDVLEAIKPELRDFLQTIYDRILNQRVSFDENCRLMDIYLYASNLEDSPGFEETKLTLVNTLLVHFKEDTFKRLKECEEYYSYVFRSLYKIVENADENQGSEAIRHIFVCFQKNLFSTDAKYARVVFRRIEDFIKSFKGRPFYIKEMKSECSYLRLNVFNHFLSSSDISETVKIFNIFLSIFKDQETRKAQELVAEKVQKYLISSKLHKFMYIDEHDKCIKAISPCLGYSECKIIKTLEKNLRNRKNEEIQAIAEEFSGLFNDVNDNVKILMEATRIVENGKENAFQIFFECKQKILKNPVISWYLHGFLKMEAPVLSKADQEQVSLLKLQFGHLKA